MWAWGMMRRPSRASADRFAGSLAPASVLASAPAWLAAEVRLAGRSPRHLRAVSGSPGQL
eukprot:15237437-Alexandrium_andersonii.AAC.1